MLLLLIVFINAHHHPDEMTGYPHITAINNTLPYMDTHYQILYPSLWTDKRKLSGCISV